MISTFNYTHLTKKKKEKKHPPKGLSSVVSPPFLCTLNIRAGVMLPKVRMRCLNVLTGSVVLSWQIILWPAGVFTDSHHQFLVIPNCTARALSSTCLLHTLWALTMPPPLAASFPSPSLLPDPPPSDHLLFSSSLCCSPLFRLSSHMWQIPIKYLERGKIACGPCGGGIFSFIIRNNIDTCAITTAWLWMKEERRTLKATGLWGSAYSKKLLASSRLLSTLVIARTCVPALIIQ